MPGATHKNSLRDKLEDDVLDLSLMQLDEVPIEEIVSWFRIRIYFFHANLIYFLFSIGSTAQRHHSGSQQQFVDPIAGTFSNFDPSF